MHMNGDSKISKNSKILKILKKQNFSLRKIFLETN